MSWEMVLVDFKWFKVHTRNRVPHPSHRSEENRGLQELMVEVGGGDSGAWKSSSKDQTAGDKTQQVQILPLSWGMSSI